MLVIAVSDSEHMDNELGMLSSADEKSSAGVPKMNFGSSRTTERESDREMLTFDVVKGR